MVELCERILALVGEDHFRVMELHEPVFDTFLGVTFDHFSGSVFGRPVSMN